jgi:hypothetical protein
MRVPLTLTCVVLVFSVGCGTDEGSSPTSPTVSSGGTNISGNWAGTFTDVAGAVRFEMSLVQSATTISGTWLTRMPSGSVNEQGNVSGSLSGGMFSGALSFGECSADVSGPASASGLTWTGNQGFVGPVTCSDPARFTISVQRN